MAGCLLTAAAASDFPEFPPNNGRQYLQIILEEAHKAFRHEARGCYLLARVHNQLGDRAEAERLAGVAIIQEPTRPEFHLFVGDLLILQDRLNEALDHLQKALDLQPDAPGGHRRLGMVLERLGYPDRAQAAFEAAIRASPKDPAAHQLLGKLLLEAGHSKEAAEHLHTACATDANVASAFYLLAQAEQQLGNQNEATAALARFRELKENERTNLDRAIITYDDERFMRSLAASLHVELAELWNRRHQRPAAEAHLRQAIHLYEPHVIAHERLGELLVNAKRFEEARSVLTALTRLRPNEPKYHSNLGTMLIQTGAKLEGVSELNLALQLNPKQLQALNNLARFYLGERTNLTEALQLSRALTDLEPSAANYDLLGWACFANGRLEEARTAAARAVQLEPSSQQFRQRQQKLLQIE